MWALTDGGYEIVLHRGQSDGFIDSPAWTHTGRVVENPGPMGMADLDGDGLPELLYTLISVDGDGVTTGGQVVAVHNDGGLFGDQPWKIWRGTTQDGGLGQLLATGDFDGDGFDDVAALSGGGVAGESVVHIWRSPKVDCDDGDAARNAGAIDVPDDGVDQDCDGADTITPPDTDPPATDATDPSDEASDQTDVSDTDTDKAAGGCACDQGGGQWSVAPALLALLWRRRRKSGG
jgi:hypothetical protein